jgi:hypothetical protein
MMMCGSLSMAAQNLQRIDSTFLPVSDTLKSYLQKYYQLKRDAEQSEFKVNYKYKLLTWLPDLGITLGGTPFVSWGTGKAINYISTVQREKSKIISLQRINEVQYNNDLALISNELATLKSKAAQYNYSLELYTIESQLFEITEKGYNDKKVPPSDFLTKKLHYKEFINNLTIQFTEICAMKNKILAEARVISWQKL